MIKSEFIERTGYEPSDREYKLIEDSYYEFNGNKDEFCKQWKKDKASGHWAKEMELRQTIDNLTQMHKEEIEELNENLDFYREQYEKLSGKGVKVSIKAKGEAERKFNDVTVQYIDNGACKFYRIEEKSGWVTCFRIEHVESMAIYC